MALAIEPELPGRRRGKDLSTKAKPDLIGPSNLQSLARIHDNAIGDHEFPAKMSNLWLIAPAITPCQWLTTV
jgi:hypothetical protein